MHSSMMSNSSKESPEPPRRTTRLALSELIYLQVFENLDRAAQHPLGRGLGLERHRLLGEGVQALVSLHTKNAKSEIAVETHSNCH